MSVGNFCLLNHFKQCPESSKLIFIFFIVLSAECGCKYITVVFIFFNAVANILNGISCSACLFYRKYFADAVFNKTSRAHHIRNVNGFHPPQPFIMNGVVNVYSDVVDEHKEFKVQGLKFKVESRELLFKV